MRKIIFIFLLLVIAALGYLAYAHFSGGAVPTFGLPLGGERAQVRHRVLNFFENIKFKNTKALHSFVDKEITSEKISEFVSHTLGVQAYNFDLHSTKINEIELDSRHERARVKIVVYGLDLIQKKPIELSKIIFLYKNKNDQWLVDINNASF